jgi:hypothetical protein
MNALQKLQWQAGQKKQETLYGSLLTIFAGPDAADPLADPIPCTHTQVMGDFEFGPAGKSGTVAVETLIFRADQIGKNLPEKGTLCSLRLPNMPEDGSQDIALQLWSGGLLPDGLSYHFMAVDENYKV